MRTAVTPRPQRADSGHVGRDLVAFNAPAPPPPPGPARASLPAWRQAAHVKSAGAGLCSEVPGWLLRASASLDSFPSPNSSPLRAKSQEPLVVLYSEVLQTQGVVS